MCYITNKMLNQVANRFLWFNIFLPALAAEPASNICPAIEAGFITAQMMLHPVVLLKIIYSGVTAILVMQAVKAVDYC